MAEYSCPCGCGLQISVTRACCRPAWERLPARLQRRLTATTGFGLANPAARRAAFAAIADWLQAHPTDRNRHPPGPDRAGKEPSE